jgi:AcrR family transcriptional regulator
VAAATTLFLADGYAATPVRAVASAAGVAEKTVYLQFATKLALLKAVVETAIVGDDDEVPVAGREWFQAVVAEQDLNEKLRKLVAGSSALLERTGATFAMAQGAASVDPDAAALWAQGKQGHLADMTRLAESFLAGDLLPAGATLDWAIQLLYILIGPESWQLARIELGLDPKAYQDWLLNSLTRSLQPAP